MLRASARSRWRTHSCDILEGLPIRIECGVADRAADEDEEESPEGEDADRQLRRLEERLGGGVGWWGRGGSRGGASKTRWLQRESGQELYDGMRRARLCGTEKALLRTPAASISTMPRHSRLARTQLYIIDSRSALSSLTGRWSWGMPCDSTQMTDRSDYRHAILILANTSGSRRWQSAERRRLPRAPEGDVRTSSSTARGKTCRIVSAASLQSNVTTRRYQVAACASRGEQLTWIEVRDTSVV